MAREISCPARGSILCAIENDSQLSLRELVPGQPVGFNGGVADGSRRRVVRRDKRAYTMASQEDLAQILAFESEILCRLFDGESVTNNQADGGPIDGRFRSIVCHELHGLSRVRCRALRNMLRGVRDKIKRQKYLPRWGKTVRAACDSATRVGRCRATVTRVA